MRKVKDSFSGLWGWFHIFCNSVSNNWTASLLFGIFYYDINFFSTKNEQILAPGMDGDLKSTKIFISSEYNYINIFLDRIKTNKKN